MTEIEHERDPLDEAANVTNSWTEAAIRAASMSVAHGFTDGVCAWCGEEWSDKRHFCNADCRDDWEKAGRLGK